MKKSIPKYLLYILSLLSFLQPPYLSVAYPKIVSILKIIQIALGVFFLLKYLKKDKVSKFQIFFVITQFWLFICCLKNGISFKQSFIDFMQISLFSIFLEYAIKYETKIFFKSFLFLFECYIIINFFSIILNPNGMYINPLTKTSENFFLGYKNGHITYILPLLLIEYINMIKSNKSLSLRFIVFSFLSIITELILWSGTSLIGVFIFVLATFILEFRENTRSHINLYLKSYVILYFSIIIFRLHNVFSFIIVDSLKKDLTFTGRTGIWDKAIGFINKELLFGYGSQTSLEHSKKYNAIYATSAHNQVLEIIYQGGIPFLILNIYLVILVKKKLSLYNNKISSMISLCIFIILIMMLMEYYSINNYLIVFLLGYNISYLVGDKNEGNSNNTSV